MKPHKWSDAPWNVEIYKEPYNSHVYTYQVVSSDGLIVAKCGSGDFQVPDNARLIAFAPALFAALEGVIKCIEADMSLGHAIDTYYYRQAKNAINAVYGTLPSEDLPR